MSALPAERARVGLIGCGIIAKAYAEGAVAFDSFSVEACADSDAERAEALAAGHGLEVMSVEGLISSPEIDVILNLTPPTVHAAVVGGALEAGKHVYTEKPLTTSLPVAQELVASADRLGLRIGCAPDTFLSSAYEAARALITRGDIGEPLGATATMLVGGPDNWHPNADFFYRAGGGPMLDLAPYYLTAIASLLGPFASATGFATTPTPERTLGVGPRKGEKFTVDVPTHVAAALRLESGALATLTVSFESRGRYDSRMTVHGTEGALSLPDANQFDGDLAVFERSRRMGGRSVRVTRGAGDARLRSARDARSSSREAAAPCVGRARPARARDGDGGAPLGGRRSHDRCRFAIHVDVGPLRSPRRPSPPRWAPRCSFCRAAPTPTSSTGSCPTRAPLPSSAMRRSSTRGAWRRARPARGGQPTRHAARARCSPETATSRRCRSPSKAARPASRSTAAKASSFATAACRRPHGSSMRARTERSAAGRPSCRTAGRTSPSSPSTMAPRARSSAASRSRRSRTGRSASTQRISTTTASSSSTAVGTAIVRRGAFVDPAIPSWYSPFGIQVVGARVFVTYASPAPVNGNDSPKGGYVDEFDLDGRLVSRVDALGPLERALGPGARAGRVRAVRRRSLGRQLRQRQDQCVRAPRAYLVARRSAARSRRQAAEGRRRLGHRLRQRRHGRAEGHPLLRRGPHRWRGASEIAVHGLFGSISAD